MKTFLRVFTYKMAAKASWHRYGTKLRHCHPMYFNVRSKADVSQLNLHIRRMERQVVVCSRIQSTNLVTRV